MKICVVKPSLFGRKAKDALPPLLFAILLPLTPPDVELVFYDENIEQVPKSPSCSAVAISIDTFTAQRGYFLADRYRKQGIPVILGGIHVSFCPEEASLHADAIVIGEAEDTWGLVVRDLRQGALMKRYFSENNIELSEVSYDYSVYSGKKYNPVMIAQFTRGCKYACDFCSVHALHGSLVRTRPVSAVAETVGKLPKGIVFFADDNLFSNQAEAERLLTALRALKRRWVCQISIDAAKDPGFLMKLRQSGCIMVIIGFESLEPENLRQMRKAANLSSVYETAIANIHKAGLMIYGTFVIGYDADTAETAGKLVSFAEEHRFAIANFNPLIPTPGTPLYDRLASEGRLLYEAWWNDPLYCYGDTAYKPAAMTPEELAESCRKARVGFYSARSIIKRFRGANIRNIAHAVAYMLANIISGISISQKQGRKLGG
ncbi:MAG: B12-binding domain-containing radical SAM protein [Eubacteriaceae bacterium]|nr:B12-binding domain-containing radical SAM protein [Eubacteriaceae bacterium]